MDNSKPSSRPPKRGKISRSLHLILLITCFSFPLGRPGLVLSQSLSLQDSVFGLYMDFARSKNQAQREENSRDFSEALRQALAMDEKGDFAFDSLLRYKVMVKSPDNQVRVFTWDLEADDATHTFYGFIHSYSRKQKKYELFELKDKSEGMKDPENVTLDNTKWFGAYYYQMVPVKHKKKKYYVLLGWDGNNRVSNKRLIDVLYFTDKGMPKFGEAIFSSEGGKVKKRVIFEYQAGLFMSLKYDEELEGILFDHLSPPNPGLDGQYSFYGPDFSYDILQFKDGKWFYKKNVLPRNEKGRPDKHFNTPK